VALPGADAEANSNVLRGRSILRASVAASADAEDPLIAAAEAALEGAATEPEAVPERTQASEPGPDVQVPVIPAPREPEPEFTSETTMELLLPELAPQAPAQDATEEPAAMAATAVTTGTAGTADAPGPGSPGPAQALAGDTTTARADMTTARADTTPAGVAETDSRTDGTAPGATETASHPGEPAAERAPAADVPEATATEAPADPYAIGPDDHERVPDEHPRVTDKGLPKRTPKISAPATAPRPRMGGVDADALRRRLGGFHRGAIEGRRDVEAEIADRTAETPTPEGQTPPAPTPAHAPAGPASTDHRTGAQDVEASGGTVEEASS
jgi:hypothetical protein